MVWHMGACYTISSMVAGFAVVPVVYYQTAPWQRIKTLMSKSEKVASPDAPGQELRPGQIAARMFIDADQSMWDVAAYILKVCFGDNAEPDHVTFVATGKDFRADAKIRRAVRDGLTVEDMAQEDMITKLGNYARKNWSRLLYGEKPSDPNCVKAICLLQGREFIAPKKPVSQASKDAKARKEANMTAADRAQATADAAAKKAATVKMDAARVWRDSCRTDITQIGNAKINAIKGGAKADTIKKISASQNRISKALDKELEALAKIS